MADPTGQNLTDFEVGWIEGNDPLERKFHVAKRVQALRTDVDGVESGDKKYVSTDDVNVSGTSQTADASSATIPAADIEEGSEFEVSWWHYVNAGSGAGYTAQGRLYINGSKVLDGSALVEGSAGGSRAHMSARFKVLSKHASTGQIQWHAWEFANGDEMTANEPQDVNVLSNQDTSGDIVVKIDVVTSASGATSINGGLVVKKVA